jgi:hypothetical protein
MKRKVVVTDGLVMLYQVLLSNSFSASSLRLRKLIKNDNQENTVNCLSAFYEILNCLLFSPHIMLPNGH